MSNTRSSRTSLALTGIALAASVLASPAAHAQAKELNIYSARHYQTDQQLYDGFAKAHGVTNNRVDSDDAGVMQRLRAEGASSPADVVLMVDAEIRVELFIVLQLFLVLHPIHGHYQQEQAVLLQLIQ